MMKTLFLLSAFLLAAALVSACATTGPEDYAFEDCDSLRALANGQDYAASFRGVRLENDRGVEEIRPEFGSSRTGRSRPHVEKSLRDERQAVRDAYRRNGCKA